MYRKIPRKCSLSEQPCWKFHYRPQLSLPADVYCKHSEQYSQRSWQNRTHFRLQYVKSFGTAWICLFRHPPVGHPRLPVGASGQPGGTDPAVYVCSAQIPLTKIQSFVRHYKTQIPLAELLHLYCIQQADSAGRCLRCTLRKAFNRSSDRAPALNPHGA